MTMEASDLAAALGRLAGTERLLVYDVSEPEAPERRNPAVPFVRGGGAWWRFVERRRALDDGADLNLLVSLRGLRADERLLAVSWGCAFANSFLVVEPADPWLDLTTPDGAREFAARSRRRHTHTLLPPPYPPAPARLPRRGAELFGGGGGVARAVPPSLPRLGLPILYDARHVMDG